MISNSDVRTKSSFLYRNIVPTLDVLYQACKEHLVLLTGGFSLSLWVFFVIYSLSTLQVALFASLPVLIFFGFLVVFLEQHQKGRSVDPVTELPNKKWFLKKLSIRHRRSSRYGKSGFLVLFIDLDRFRSVAGSLGSHYTDRVLKILALRLSGYFSSRDVICRFERDEFAVLVEKEMTTDQARLLADQAQELARRPIKIEEREIFVSLSIGIALYSSRYEEAGELLSDAMSAMQRAKLLGKARSEIFEPTMRSQAEDRLRLEYDLRGALLRDEFCLHYQPIVSLSDGQLSGFEALIRWNHPILGLLTPAHFISLAEETGMIIPLGRWVLEEACKQAKLWQEEHPLDSPIFMSVNLSSKELLQPGLVDAVTQILEDTELSPSSLKLEITEGMLVQDMNSAEEVLLALKEVGVLLSIDDFGTGYSSLNYLHRFPFDVLKIDRSFVGKIRTDTQLRAIVEMIVSLAHRLQMEVVAEGIETPLQRQELGAFNCKYGQGYLFSTPLDGANARIYLSESSSSLTSVDSVLPS